jgi:type IV secretory pathway VirB10-like protein
MPSPTANPRNLIALVAVGVSLASGGCLGRNPRATSPAAIAPQPIAARPMTVAPDTDAQPPLPPATPPPAIAENDTAPPLPDDVKLGPPPAPPKPVAEQPPAEPPGASAHTPAPQISPQLSQADQQSLERTTTDDTAAAEKNLQQAGGKPLSASQKDMLEKAQSFLEQARDAGKSGDWARAQNLAHKARSLSAELVNSL